MNAPNEKSTGRSPWFAFYPGDYIRDTQHLSVIEHGMYLKLMLFYYSTGKPVPHSRRYAVADATALPGDMLEQSQGYAMVDGLLAEFFYRDGDVWRHKRIEEELAKRQDFHEKQKDRAKKRWEKKPSKPRATAMPRHSHGNAGAMPGDMPLPQPQPHIGEVSPITPLPPTPKTKGKPFTLPEWVDPATWAAFVEHRQRIKKPMTELAKELTVRQLDKLRASGEDPKAVLEQSITKCWVGIFAIKQENDHGNQAGGRAGQTQGYGKPSLTETIAEQIARIE